MGWLALNSALSRQAHQGGLASFLFWWRGKFALFRMPAAGGGVGQRGWKDGFLSEGWLPASPPWRLVFFLRWMDIRRPPALALFGQNQYAYLKHLVQCQVAIGTGVDSQKETLPLADV